MDRCRLIRRRRGDFRRGISERGTDKTVEGENERDSGERNGEKPAEKSVEKPAVCSADGPSIPQEKTAASVQDPTMPTQLKQPPPLQPQPEKKKLDLFKLGGRSRSSSTGSSNTTNTIYL